MPFLSWCLVKIGGMDIIMQNYDVVKNDFNQISDLNDKIWNHNNCYFDYILKYVKTDCQLCLDIGCGKGELSNLLSKRSENVIGVDLADKMIDKAITRYGYKNIEFINRNVLEMNFKENSIDIIITTSTAHHLPYEWLLEFAKKHLKPKGKLIILDLYLPKTFSDKVLNVLAIVPNIIMNIFYNHRLQKDDDHSREIWKKHGENDVYMPLKDIKELADKHLSQVTIKRKLFWRYVLVWQK